MVLRDCANAFDKIHHGILWSKLVNFGFAVLSRELGAECQNR